MSVLESAAEAAVAGATVDNATEAALAAALAVGPLNRRLRFQSASHTSGWMEHDGVRWVPSADRVPLALQAEIRRIIAAGLEARTVAPSAVPRLESAHGMRGIASLLSAWPTMHLPGDIDPPGLLATPGAVIDLHSGQRLAHDPARPITRCTPVDPGPGCPFWTLIEAHLRACLGDAYTGIHRFLGSSLLGLGADRKLVWLTGPGGDGKSTLAKVLRVALGDYLATVPAEVFQASSRGAHLHELGSGMHGARLAVALEINGTLDWPRLKGISGGDEQVSKRLYGKTYISSRPPSLLMIANDLPTPPDHASSDRIIIGTMAPPVDADERLMVVLKEGGVERDRLASACLSWLLRGCADYLRDGLGPVRTAARAPESLEVWWERSVGEGQILPGQGWTPLAAFADHLQAFLSPSNQSSPHERELSNFLTTRVEKRRDKHSRRYNATVVTHGDASCRPPHTRIEGLPDASPRVTAPTGDHFSGVPHAS